MENENITMKRISKDMFKQTLKSVIYFLGITSLFLLFNIVFILITNNKNTLSLSGSPQYIVVLIQLLISIVFLIGAIIFTKKYILIGTISVGYGYLTPFFRKFSDAVASAVYNKGMDLSKTKHITKTIDIGSLLKDSYTQKVPRIAQKGINLLLNQIPFTYFFQNIQREIKQNENNLNVEFVRNKLYEQTDSYIKNMIFGGNNLSWIFWLFPLNIVIQYLFFFLCR